MQLFIRTLILSSSIQILLGASSFALTNSTPAIADHWQSVVMLKIDAKDTQSSDVVPGYCNGTMIHPQLVLTAAHCVVHAELLRAYKIHIEVGHYKYVTRPDGRVVRVGYLSYLKTYQQARFHLLPQTAQKLSRSGFNIKLSPDEDIAIIQLQAPLELASDFSYAKMLPRSQWQSFISSRTPRLKTTTINFVSETGTDFKKVADLSQVWVRGNWVESKSHSRVEPMDSGGGLFLSTAQGLYWVGAVKGRGQNIFSNWDAFALGGPRLCTLAQSQRLSVDQQKALCP